MKIINSYIFLERKKEKSKFDKERNVIIVNLQPTFQELLQRNFPNIKFYYKKNLDIMNAGTFNMYYNNSNELIEFKYHNVGGNYYLDIIVSHKSAKIAIDIMNLINDKLVGNRNIFEENYISITSYDSISEYYCNKLFPYLNNFERKLRKVLFNIYTLNFNMEYFSATTNEEFQRTLKKKANTKKNRKISEDDRYIKLGFYSLDYNDINTLLFTKSITKRDEEKLNSFLNDTDDLSKLSDEELRKKFNILRAKTDWERFFGDKKIDDNFQSTFDEIRNFRNNIAHCKFIDKQQYEECIDLLKKINKSLDKAILITEHKDFIEKNIELENQAFMKLTNLMINIISDIYKPILDNIDKTITPLTTLSDKISSMVVPSFPEINIPNAFQIKDDKQE